MAAEEQPKCPVDHNTRQAWLDKANAKPEVTPQSCPVDHTAREDWLSKISVSTVSVPESIEVKADPGCSSDTLDAAPPSTYDPKVGLSVEREISSIPRTSANSNWVYPSQKQFFDAMHRKSWNPQAQDMKTIVPIHNAVNERAWRHILNWESAYYEHAMKQCGGITLTSFKGDSKKLTPRAWFNSTFLGYSKPFDRHDWIVNRCGTEVEYVIDFYGGSSSGQSQAASFYLDVRPKINSWEGIKLRVGRAFGFL